MTNSFSGMKKDISDALFKNNLVTHARNAITSSQNGDMIEYQTEWGTVFCTEPTYTPINLTPLPDGSFAVFCTDNTNSEIGMFNELKCTYTPLLNASWLNFSDQSLITCQSKENEDGTFSIYWSDGRRNPDRILNLSHTKTATYDNTLLAKKITPPLLSIIQSNNGVLPDATYSAAVAYSANKVKFSDYYSLTLPIPILKKEKGGALEISISSLDSDFNEFELVVLQSKDSTIIAKRIGFFPKNTRSVTVSNFDRSEYEVIPLENLPITNPPVLASDQITGNNQYLFRIGTETVPELNYQLKAFDIESEYVVYQVPENYYEKGDKVGLYRDEVYSHVIQWLHTSGYWSAAFHIPGREATSDDTSNAANKDAYETSITTCEEVPKIKRWQIENTAGQMKPSKNKRTDTCKEIEIGSGKMGYYESTDTYPENTYQFGKWAGTPIRFPKTPNEAITPRYSVIQGKNYINILGMRFSKIPHPQNEDGSLDTNWVGYRILRQSREGNRSVVSRGILTNMRSYTEQIDGIKREVYYPNYGVNSLDEDPFLSQTQTSFKNKKETHYKPLKTFHTDKFTFYSPHNNIGRYSPTTEVVFETEESANIEGFYEKTEGHPKLTLLTQFSFWLVMAIAILETSFEASGQKGKTNTSTKGGISGNAIATGDTAFTLNFGLTAAAPFTKTSSSSTSTTNNSILSLTGSSVTSSLRQIMSGDLNALQTILTIIRLIAAAAVTGVLFTLTAMSYANQLLKIIYDFIDPTDYVWQFNGKAFFNKQSTISKGNRRRYVTASNYLLDGIQEVNDLTINNFSRADAIFLQLNDSVKPPKDKDDSLQLYSDGKITSKGVAYYGTLKNKIPNQYGRLENAFQFVTTHNNYFPGNATEYQTIPIFGGDCWINRFSIKNPFLFFTQDLAFPHNDDNVGYDYRFYRNIAYPRFWLSSFKYDFSSLLNKTVINRTQFTRTTTALYNLDDLDKGANKFRVDGKMYTSYNTVLEFFVESDFNLEAREKPKDGSTYYKNNDSTDLIKIFNPQKLKLPEQFIYDKSFSRQSTEIFAEPQRTDFDPNIFRTRHKYSNNRLAYSLPSWNEQTYDNWQYFLANNIYEFPRAEFGNLTGIHRVDGERLMFLFDRSSPYITLGRNQLETKDNSIAIQIGDGGLFAQPARELGYTEEHYGNSQSKLGASTNRFGTFYVSERQGRILKFSNNLEEVTSEGMYFWAKEYFPLRLKETFSNYTNTDNPVSGCGFLTSFDSKNALLYITKRDFKPLYPEITTDGTKFYYKGLQVSLKDNKYFEDISFTLSYSPLLNQFISLHDWHPELSLSTENNLITIKDKKIYLHNKDHQNPCTYYGKTYPFEVEYVNNSNFKTEMLTSLFYYLDSFKYYKDGINRYSTQDNFSTLLIYNKNQFSGVLKLNKYPDNPYEAYQYPKQTKTGYEILYELLENKFTINQFHDAYGDFSKPPVLTKDNGYEIVANTPSLNFNKHPLQYEDFRNYSTRIRFIKENPTSHLIFKISASESLDSPR